MKKALMILGRGFEDLEAITMIDVFGWTRTRWYIKPVELHTCGFHDEVTGKFGTSIGVNINLNKDAVDAAGYDALILPGGFQSSGYEEVHSAEIYELIRTIYRRGGIIVGLCVGALPIADAGVLKKIKATTYFRSRFHRNTEKLKRGGALYTGSKLEVDGNVISCAGPAYSLEATYVLLEKMTGKKNADHVKRLMIH